MAVPQAQILLPSTSPLLFQEVSAFQGETTTDPIQCKAIGFSPDNNFVVVSLNVGGDPYWYTTQIFNSLTRIGVKAPFGLTGSVPPTTFRAFRSVEGTIAVVPPGIPVTMGGFTAGDIWLNRGTDDGGGQLSHLNSAGQVVNGIDPWATVGPTTTQGLWGGLAFDIGGLFGGHLVALTFEGQIYLVGPAAGATPSLLVDLSTHGYAGSHMEGLAVAPASFGPYAGYLIVGVEGIMGSDTDPNSGQILAIDGAGNINVLANIGFAAENMAFVPPNGGMYYQCELCFDRARQNRVLSVSPSQFLGRLGHLIAVNELGNAFWDIAWNGSIYTQQYVGRVPGRWSSQGFNIQGTELEQGTFAELEPVLSSTWTNWAPLSTAQTTDSAPAASMDASGNLQCLVRGNVDSKLYLNSMYGNAENWTGWGEMPPGGFTSPYGPALAMQDNVLWAFAVQSGTNKIFTVPLYAPTGYPTAWAEVSPGGQTTNAAPSAALINGRLALCVKGLDNNLYLNELQPGGRTWNGWNQIPGGLQTDQAPALMAFQDELYLVVHQPGTSNLQVLVRSVDDVWTPIQTIPGTTGSTNLSPAGVAFTSSEAGDFGHLYMILVDTAGTPQANLSSDTGTWSLLLNLPGTSLQTASAVGVATLNPQGSFGYRLFFFARDQNNNIQVRKAS